MTPQQAMELFDYDPASGVLRWRQRSARCVRVGSEAGSVKADGYRVISYQRKGYPSHRIAWTISTGSWPAGILDHINGNKLDNRIENLRVANVAVNSQNQRRAHRSNQSCGILGVHFYARTGRWRATIWVEGRNRFLGYFATADEASAAYLKAKRELHVGCTV